MPERRHIRASEAQDGRSERPATGYGEPDAGADRLRHDRLKPVLRYGRLEGEPSQVEANLGFASDLPSPPGPGMARRAYV